MNPARVYCIDSSALIAGHNRIYPRRVFAGLWSKMGDLIDEGRLFAPEEVWKELEYQADDLTQWAKDHGRMFVSVDYRQTAFLTEIARDFPQLSRSKVAANTADPFVIALAKVKNYVVVSEERGGSIANPKIPLICDHYKVPHIPFLRIILDEGWVFL
jgi:hypothetical protein